MKQRFNSSFLWMFTMLLLPLGAWADREVNQLQFGKQVIEVATDEVITFYDPWGTENVVDKNANNAQSLTVFKPAEAGKSVQITFEKIDLQQYSASYFLYMNLYDGIADSDNAFTWATSASEVTSSSNLSNMTGTLIAEKITNENKPSLPAVYTSGTADGALSVAFMHRNSNTCEGWVAKVKVVTLENMTITGAGSNYDGVVASPTTKQNVALANAYVTATGVMNPDNVTGIYFKMTKNEGVVDPTALKLFKGDTQLTATVEADGDNYKFVCNQAPNDGTTTFTIKGDILGTAAVGAKVRIDITKVTTTAQTEGITPFAADSAVIVENPAIVLMTATPQTVTVGNTPLQFYDEGGKDGGILAKTNGQVTFLSGDDSKKVMVNFTTNAIWHGSLYNQELRIYSGQEVSADKLIRTLQKEETGIVRSTADDGSLTVVLFSDASSTTAADGFEAEVSLFTPQPMDFNGITTTAASTETVAAGDANQQILSINVKALNTEPAMKVTKMAFATNETNALVANASLFFNNNKVGETVVAADTFVITLDTPQALAEGDNIFTLAYTISDDAVNEQIISAKAVSVTALVNDIEKTETVTESAVVSRSVNNLVLSQANQGTVKKTVKDSIAFETKTASSYSSYCEAGTDTRINIFVPKNEGMVAQIDFSEFNVQYSSSSYGNKSVFKIYAGQGTTGTLLWELNDNAQESTGPGQVIRSTAADGALTIVFNPNTSYSYYYKGFKATVSEYLSKDMEVTAVEATQTSTADVSIGTSEQALLTVNVKTEGNLNPMSLNSIKLNLKGTEANIDSVSIWQGETKLAKVLAAAETIITFDEAIALTESYNLFNVMVDVSGTAQENETIDASVTSVCIGALEVAATAGNPDGCRTLKNMILMTAGNHGEMALGLGRNTNLYDDGGPEGDGSDGVEATITLAPTGDADCIKLTDKGINFNYTSHLYIYKGSEVDNEKLIVDLSGSSAKFTPIISDAEVEGGKLTIKYVGKGSYTKPNFAMQAEGYKKVALTVDSITTEDISVSEVLKGQSDVKMIHVTLYAKGDLDSLVVKNFAITENDGTAADTLRIYQTGTAASFSPTNVLSDSVVIKQEGTYHYWIVADIKADATIGQTASASLTTVNVNGIDINVKEPTACATVTVASGKSGTYIVGQGGTYTTIQGAIDDLGTLGMEGPVVLKIKAGNYNEKVRIPYIKGMGATNTLTLESESGERDVKIYHDNYTTGGYSDDQHKKDYGVVTLYQANYVALKNLEISTSDKAYKAVVMVKDESRHVTIDNCYLHAPVCTASNGEDVCLVGHTIIDEENKNNDYLTVKNCLLEGGKMGVSMGGTNYVALPKEVGGVIEGNTFKNNGQKSIYVMDELGVKIKNNTVIIEADVETKVSVGVLDMQLRDEYAEATEITGNIFNVAPKTYAAVMNLRQLEGTAEAPVVIANNVINLTSLNASYSAFKLNGSKINNVNIAHNTFRMTGENGGAAFWVSSKLDEGYGNINVVNNIIQNETSGYAVNLYNDDNLGIEKINFQHNLISTTGNTFFRASSSTDGNFDAFVEKTGATGCINKQAVFVSNEIMEPSSTLDGDLLKALKLDYVTTDIQGTARPAENISIGAYEYDPDLTRIPVIAEGYPKATAIDWHTAMVSVKADMNGKAYITVLNATDDAPTAEVIKNSQYTMSLNKETEAQLKVDTLKEKTDYVAYVLVESTRGNATDIVATDTITTPMEPIPLIIACTEPETTIAEGSEAELKVMVGCGLAPFKVTWLNSKQEMVADTTVNVLGEDIIIKTTPIQSGDYYVTIKDAQQFEEKDTCRIIVTGKALVADFENLYLANNSNWHGPDTKGTIEEGLYGDEQYQGSFLSGSYKFSNNYSIDWASWSGFSYSNRTDTIGSNIISDQWNAITGCGADSSATYAVFYEDSFAPMTVTVLNREEGDSIHGFYITNAAVTVNAFENGDGMTPGAFTTGDYLKLIITAKNDEEVEFYLADYRSENEEEHYYVKDWQWVDLTSLGTVKELTFHLVSSRSNTWGYTTPLYFCMDNFNGTAPVEPVIHEGPATMEDLELADESFWNGSDGAGSFISGVYLFENGYETSDYGPYAYGWFYSNKTDTTFTDYTTDMYNSCVGHGAEESKTYAVFNVNDYTPKGIEVIAAEGDSISGFYVTNAAYTYTSMKNGDNFAKKFGYKDWLKLTITGYDVAGETTGTVDFYLADLRNADSMYIHNTWRWVDLTSLGKVKRLGFTMSSSDTGDWGMNTPAYFCLDNLGGEKPAYEEPVIPLPTEILNQKTNSSVAKQHFDLSGRQLHQVQKGMNIIRMTDGSVRKVIVK